MFVFTSAKFLRRVRCTEFYFTNCLVSLFFSGQSRCHGSPSGRRSVDEIGGGLWRSVTSLTTSQHQGGSDPPFLQMFGSRGVALTQTDLGLEAWVGFKVLTQSCGFLCVPTSTSQGGVFHTASPNPSPVEESGRGPPLGVKGSVSVSVSPSAR